MQGSPQQLNSDAVGRNAPKPLGINQIHYFVSGTSYAVSQFNLGVKFALGQGVGRDPSEAMHWYRRAAQFGSAHAQNNLGTIYATGDGVPINHKEAAEWYRRAAEQNHAKAQYNMVLQQNLWARLCCGKSARV